MGLCPSPDVAGDQFTGHREERRFLNRTNVAECLQRDHLYSLMPTIFLTLKRSLNVLHPTQRMFLSIQFSDLFPGGQGDTAHRRRRVKKYPRRRFRTCLFRRDLLFCIKRQFCCARQNRLFLLFVWVAEFGQFGHQIFQLDAA